MTAEGSGERSGFKGALQSALMATGTSLRLASRFLCEQTFQLGSQAKNFFILGAQIVSDQGRRRRLVAAVAVGHAAT
jgi:hypothetical protein